MSKKFMKMPLEESPWINQHAPEDVNNYLTYFRELATSVADLLKEGDSRTYGPFLSGAQQAVERYNITTRAHKITKRSTFRFSEMKEGVASVFVIPDVSRKNAQLPLMELYQYCFAQEMKRHKNKHALVHIIADEAGNQTLPDLDEQTTWSRGYGLRYMIYGQNIPALRKNYGPEAVSSIISESEIVLFLKGTRDQETLELIVKMLGDASYIAVGRSGSTDTKDFEIGGTSYQEDGKPLLTTDQIRRLSKGILFIRSNKPMLVDLPSVAAIDPFRDQIDINPFHGKPYRLPIKLKITRSGKRAASLFRRMRELLRRGPKRQLAEQKYHLWRMGQHCRRVSRLISVWPVLALALFFISPIGPHLAVSYEGSRCTYLGSRGFVWTDHGPECPLLAILNKEDWQ
ncbi:MAG: type IV secretory system conjugative DNA transfer family protein [Alphaproteobacteria bacterium]